jgi:hypothetical protein
MPSLLTRLVALDAEKIQRENEELRKINKKLKVIVRKLLSENQADVVSAIKDFNKIDSEQPFP